MKYRACFLPILFLLAACHPPVEQGKSREAWDLKDIPAAPSEGAGIQEGSSQPPIPPPLPPLPPENPGEGTGASNEGLSGYEVYQKECAVCHGDQGQGTERGYAVRFPVGSYATAVTRAGRSGNPLFAIPMPAYDQKSISDQQLAEMWQYLGSFPRPTTGKELYETFCGNCHGNDGRGGFSGKNVIREIEEFSEYIRKGKNTRYPLNRRKYMPAYRPNELSREEIRLMQLHAEELRRQAGYPNGHDHDEDDDEHEHDHEHEHEHDD